jgi:AraC family transcriptional regulator
MANLQPILRTLRFIEEHLREPIGIADLAKEACYSLYHFCRTFNSVAHHSPYDYLIRRRLSESARELVETRRRLIDIAFDYQFGSAESFSRAFKRMFGIGPSLFRRRGCLDRRFLMSPLTLRHLRHLAAAGSLIPERVRLDRFRVVGVMGPAGVESSAVRALWRVFAEETGYMRSGRQASGYYGIISFPGGWGKSGYYYLAAGGLDSGEEPAALVTKTVPGGTYACFGFRGFPEDIDLILDYIFQTWLPRTGKSRIPANVIVSYDLETVPVQKAELQQTVYVAV